MGTGQRPSDGAETDWGSELLLCVVAGIGLESVLLPCDEEGIDSWSARLPYGEEESG